MLYNTFGELNAMGGATGTTAAPTSGQHQGVGRGSTGWLELTEAVKMFEPEATTQEFSEKLLKWHIYDGGGGGLIK